MNGSVPARGDEPSMYLQRPSSARSQDVSHVLTRTFREFYTREAVPPDTVKHLTTSRGGEDAYHEKYVQALKEVQEERERRMAEAAMLERHIMQAQARAMSADERELNRAASTASSFPDLGLPPVRSYFRSCIDTELMKKHNLITPEDFATQEPPLVPPPSAPGVPSYARETVSSNKRNADGSQWESPFPSARGSIDSGQLPSRSGSSFSMDGPLPPIGDYPGHELLKEAWKEQPSAEDREYNRVELANQQAKVDFAKNPRHIPPSALGGGRSLIKPQKRKAKEVGIKPKPERESPAEPSVVFVASPPVVTFSDYVIGQVYEMTLELKNVTTVLRPVRVIPPKTQYFSVSLGQFPGEQGLVAPGMDCRYMVRFAPDSLCDFDDCLTIQTQSSTSLVVRIEGRRPPPKLTLPANIDVGQCLVGGVKVGQFHLKNEGGPGRFCMMPKSAWPTVNFKSVSQAGTVYLLPFEVRPPVFELKRGQTMMLEVLFAPTEEIEYHETLTVVCDNCHVKHLTLTGEGQTAAVELFTADGGLSEATPGELCDLTAQHLIRFENLNPYTYLQKTLLVKNLTNVELPYDWITVKPFIKPPSLDPDKDEQSAPAERVQDIETVFNIEPDVGFLGPNATSKFTLTFAPPFVKEFHNALHLVLRNIPKVLPPSEPKKPSPQVQMMRSESMKSPAPDTLLPSGESPQSEDVTSLELDVKGVCEPLSVVLQPYAMTIPGQTMVETLVKRQFKMLNNSLSAILFQWEHHSSNYILEVEPPIGELGPQCEMDLELSVCGSEPCNIKHTLNCNVHHLEEPLMLHVEAEIKGPEITVEESDVNFGLVRLGDIAKTTVTLTNPCRVPAPWSIRESEAHRQSEEDLLPESEFTFSPERGQLRPLESVTVNVSYRPRTCKSLRTVFEIQVEDASDSSALLQEVEALVGMKCQNVSALLVRGEVQTPQVCLLSCELMMSDVYLDVPVCHQVSLLNQTLLATTFEWGKLEGSDASSCSVTVEPSGGRIEPRQQLDVCLYFTPHRTGEMTDLLLPVTIGEMSNPLYLALYTDVQGLSVSYKTTENSQKDSSRGSEAETSPAPEEDVCLDFGADVPLAETVKRYLYIQNKSAITAPFSLHVEYFSAKPPTPPEKTRSDSHMPNKSQRRALLSKTPNLADPLSKTPSRAHADLCKAMLREGKGAAFAISPASGVLQPFCQQAIEVTSYCDMWGQYTDKLICKVEKLEPVQVPIQLGVIGSPLHFQMVAAQPSQQPILRCGTHVSGVAPVVRQMRINNPSPFDIRLDWQTFNKDPADQQILDLILSYGRPFPLLDPEGNEVLPEEQAPSPLKRQATDLIPNSPDSTPALSRQQTDTDSLAPTPLEDRRPKVIQVTTREHGGKMEAHPYQVIPSQVVIPARGNSCINVHFTPLASCDVTHETDCVGYGLGYMSVDKVVPSEESKVTRAMGYQLDPLKLQMTAKVKPALLTIECDEDEGMRYRAAASDLLENGQIAPQCLRLRRTTLTNNTMTPLVFRLLSSEPFHIVQLDSVTKKPVAQLLQTELTTLRPRENALVQVGFQLTLDLLEYLDALEGGQYDGVEAEEKERERKLHFKHDLVIEFNNKSTQRIPLSASLVVPSVHLSKESLDFGTCFVGQRRELQIMLSNPTCSASVWTCVQERQSSNSVEDTFAVTPTSGMLDAHITHISDSKVLIQIYFTAKHSETYDAVYIFHGILGEQPRRLYLKGEGSYDGKHEAIVNV